MTTLDCSYLFLCCVLSCFIPILSWMRFHRLLVLLWFQCRNNIVWFVVESWVWRWVCCIWEWLGRTHVLLLFWSRRCQGMWVYHQFWSLLDIFLMVCHTHLWIQWMTKLSVSFFVVPYWDCASWLENSATRLVDDVCEHHGRTRWQLVFEFAINRDLCLISIILQLVHPTIPARIIRSLSIVRWYVPRWHLFRKV